jgi:hypothetical protein
MSHGMKNRDYQLGLTMGWHGLTQVLEVIPGFKHEILRVPCELAGAEVPGWSWLVDSQSKLPIGSPVADSFQFANNARWMQTVNDALSFMDGAKIASVGTYGDLAKRYVSIEVGETVKYAIGKREFVDMLNLQDAIDGSMQAIAKGSNICIVCQNTFNMSLHGSGETFGKAKHTKTHAEKWEGIEKAIEAFFNKSAEFRRLMETASEVTVTEDRAKAGFAGFLSPEGEGLSTRGLGTVNRMTELFLTGKGNDGRNALDVISAVTDYYTHESAGGENRMKQLESSEVGAGAKAKDSFLALVSTKTRTFNKQAFGSLVKVGETVLANSEKE